MLYDGGGDNNEQMALAVTPMKSSGCGRCLNCACQRFQTDADVTKAVNSDEATDALIGWLSGAANNEMHNKDVDGPALLDKSIPCPNRLTASIAVLNAIRDACRPYLEAATTSAQSPSIKNSPSPPTATKKSTNTLPDFSGSNATYENSFPSLSSTASAAAPNFLAGRKKSKGAQTNNNLHVSSISTAASEPTMLVGRKKNKCQQNNIQTTRHATNAANDAPSPKQGTETHNVRKEGVNVAKKRIKPVTISLSTSSLSAFRGDLLAPSKIEGNISSLPSQETSEVAVASKVVETTTAENKPMFASPGRTGRNSTGNKAESSATFDEATNPGNEHMLKRLVMIYSTILRARLAPCLLLELHLIVRLISLPDKNVASESLSLDTSTFSEIFQCNQSCRYFGAETLSSLEAVIINMGHEIIKMLITLPALPRLCPKLCSTLQSIIYLGNSELMFESEQKALGCNTNTPHLTLPFDHARDSRHNYRSADLNRIYKEREGLRDSFLFQLRAFQDVRGRLMEQVQAEKQIASIQHESREILKSISSGSSASWFANFFCDLLLQVGLVPISETDSEVLRQIGDKKRLQKLHMRFTATSGQANKSSRKLDIDRKGAATSLSATPDQFFPGHQEFFSLFLQSGDSYKFNIHLKHRLAHTIKDLVVINETKGLCEHIAKTALLAKFLGLLEFSPNWNLSGGNVTADLATETADTRLPPIDIKNSIVEAWDRSRLVIAIPWMMQYLGMMKWDDTSRKSQYYADVFALLWSINRRCLPYRIEQHSYYQTNMVMISLQLDSFFHDVVGLASAQRLPILDLPAQYSGAAGDSTDFDNRPIWFSKTFQLSSTPHLKDLDELLLECRSGKMSTASSAKKVRPSVIRSLDGIDLNQKFMSRLSFSGDGSPSPWSGKRPGTPTINTGGGIKERLVDCFFHQHKDIQQLCELIVDKAIKNFSETVSLSIIPPIFNNSATAFEDYFNRSPPMNFDEYMELLKVTETDANEKATAVMNDDFDRIINGSLNLLAPRETKPKVIEVACTLAVNHATDKGKEIIRSAIREERKKLTGEFTRKREKHKAGVPLTSTKRSQFQSQHTAHDGISDPALQCIIDLAAALRDLCEFGSGDSLQKLRQNKARVIQKLQSCFIGTSSTQSIVNLGLQSMSLLKKVLSDPSPHETSPFLFDAIADAVEMLCLLCTLGYVNSSAKEELESSLCDINSILQLIVHTEHDLIGDILFKLMEGSVINHRSLENALIGAVKANSDAKHVSNILLTKLAASRAGGADTTANLVTMVRLQRLLQQDSC